MRSSQFCLLSILGSASVLGQLSTGGLYVLVLETGTIRVEWLADISIAPILARMQSSTLPRVILENVQVLLDPWYQFSKLLDQL